MGLDPVGHNPSWCQAHRNEGSSPLRGADAGDDPDATAEPLYAMPRDGVNDSKKRLDRQALPNLDSSDEVKRVTEPPCRETTSRIFPFAKLAIGASVATLALSVILMFIIAAEMQRQSRLRLADLA
jgi:hypothetical protein